ncbi:hypothetical protein ACJJVG_05740 [Pseudocitrobacter faecalis]|uniref:hypothetical protein n=1 Tax=Pseudocitrobacter faecalis TaxID=1398493 RepID=UPI003899DDD1
MSELTAAHFTLEKEREVTNCPQGVDLQDHLKALVAENVALKQQEPKAWYIRTTDEVTTDPAEAKMWRGIPLVMANIKTQATDSIPREAEARARIEGINYAASRLAAAYNQGFIDKPLSEVFDVVRMILSAKEDLAHTPGEDGLSGEYAEQALKNWELDLREGKAE